MMSFRGGRLGNLAHASSSVWLLTSIAESKGRQELFRRQSPQLLKALREMALIQSTESSNRIEGVTIEPDRLRPLVLGSAKPRNRSEEEIHGYRQALDLIHTSAENLRVSPETMKKLHGMLTKGAGDAGQWKRADNTITEVRPGQPPVIRFKPVSAEATPAAMDELCLSYQHAIDQEKVTPLVAAAGLVLDFLCVHPFRDGNGRVSRLLTLLVLYHHGYEVGRYIGLERLVEESKEDYYDVLKRSSEGWHEGRNEMAPWLNYFLAIVRRAYVEFEERAGQIRSPKGAKTTLVEAAIEGFNGDFSLGDVERTCPGVSRDMIQQILRNLSKNGKLSCVGRGPGARWCKKA